MIALDGEPASRSVLAHAAFVARASRADVVILHVAVEGLPIKPSLYSPERHETATQAHVRDELARAEAELRAAGVQGEIVPLLAGPGQRPLAEAVLAEATERRCDLLVLAAHPHSRLHRWLVGSTVATMTHETVNVPLLIVPTREGPSGSA